MEELELAEKLVAARREGARQASESRLRELADCIRQSGASWGVADWDDVRDFIILAGRAFAREKQDHDEDDPQPCCEPSGHRWVCSDEDEELCYCEFCGADGNA